MMGQAVKRLEQKNATSNTQRCVSFSETPLEFVHLLVGAIEGRRCAFEPYGIAIPKRLGRGKGINPVWYIDISPGHDWLTVPFNTLIDAAIDTGQFDATDIGRLSPFVEQMGTGSSYVKEFWWEREWRHCGDFALPDRVICLCPEAEIPEIQTVVQAAGDDAAFLDPYWSLEEIISHLAGFAENDVRVV
ncbi:MAG: hypothetical protein ACOYXR_10035 [Nitrospirota bacterium]